ncbi:MAG: GDP-mannose 4,6-dehydratase [Chitinophagaceae bacterium]|nr:GDP-mannose 4,6-dehydratase [Chitinophagaceae bacterium]
MKAIIFGINGQDGYYLSEVCRRHYIEVTGVSRSSGNWTQGNIADKEFVRQLISENLPDYVFHLAAASTTKHHALYENHDAIATGTIHVLEAVKDFVPHCRVFITGSGVQFVNQLKPIKETDPFDASSPYSIARIYSVYAARYYRKLGIKTYVGYLFHHESPQRKGDHLSKIITTGVKEIVSGKRQKLTIGDVTVQKEWAFAGDIAEGIFSLVNQDVVTEANISTGIAYSVEDWLRECFAYKGLDWKDFVQSPDTAFKPEYPLLLSDNSRMLSIGWKPETSFRKLVQIMMEE